MRHILLLTDRDWTHPQGGGTGANLFGQVAHWLEWGHRVTVVSGTYPGAEAVSRPAPGLELHHMGSRTTVFPRAAWAVRRGLADDADVVLEVVNGITFLTPLWLKKPRVTLVHHIHRDHYVTELGRKGAVAAMVAETLPLKLLYTGSPFLTISDSARRDMVELGIPEEDIHVGYLGVVPFPEPLAEREATPRLLYLGRLKRYKRIELLLDVLEAIPDAVLDIAGDGDHRPELEAEIAARGLGDRVVLHGHVSEEFKAELYARSWLNLTASSAEGWCLTVMEAATCGTPSVALRVGGLPESIVDGETGLLADDGPGLTAAVQRLVADDDLRSRMGAAARSRAHGFTWERTARESLTLLEETAERAPIRLREVAGRSETLKAVGMAAATMANNFIALIFTVLFARLLGAEDYGSLAALVSTFVILAVPGSAIQVAIAREIALGRLGEGPELAANLSIYRRRLILIGVVVTIGAVLMRKPIADLISVPESWAAAAALPTGVLWLLLSLERGALQGAHLYKPVAWSIVLEATGRLVFGLVLVAAGMGVAGAYFGTPLSLAATAFGLWWISRKRLGKPAPVAEAQRLRDLVGGAWPAVDRPVPGRPAAERRRDPGQAPDRRRGGRRLRRRRGRGEGRRLGGDRHRPVPAARGHARRAPRRGPAAGARPRAGRRRRRRGADADHLRAVPGDRAAAGLRAGDGRGVERAVRARVRDDAAGDRLPRRPVHARAGPRGLPARARRGGDRGDRAARRDRDEVAADVRGDRAGPAGHGGALGAGHRARDAGPPCAGGGALSADAALAAAPAEGWLTEPQARRLWAAALARPPGGCGGRDRLLPRPLDGRARAGHGLRGGDRPARGQRPRAAGDRARGVARRTPITTRSRPTSPRRA